MLDKTPPSTLRLMVGVMLGAALAMVAIAAWMMFSRSGAPLLPVAVAGALLALVAVISSQAKKL